MMDEKRFDDVIDDLSDVKLSNIAWRLSLLEKSSNLAISKDRCRDLIRNLENIQQIDNASKKTFLPFILEDFFNLINS